MKYKYTDTAGKCCMDFGTCGAMIQYDPHCGTFQCPFYKPVDCEQWIRRDGKKYVELFTPEEYYNANQQQE